MSSLCCSSRRKDRNSCGVGVIFESAPDGSLVVGGLVPGSPAEATGRIAAGDVLYEIDGRNFYKVGYGAVSAAVLGPEGSLVRLGLKRGLRYESDPVFHVDLPRRRVEGAGSVVFLPRSSG